MKSIFAHSRTFVHSFCFLFVLVAAANGWATPPPSDTITVTSGGHIAGELQGVEGEGAKSVLILKVDDALTVRLPKVRARQVRQGEHLGRYKQHAATAGDDSEKNYLLGRWCKENTLYAQSRYHMQRAIMIDPDHSKARAVLGYVPREGGGWILFSDQQRARGKVLSGSRWVYPEAVAKERLQSDANVKAKKWRVDIARHKTTYLKAKKPQQRAAAVTKLRGVRDPFAASAFGDQLEKSRGTNVPQELRLLFVDSLGNFKNSTAVRYLVQAALDDPNHSVREAALRELTKYGSRSAVLTMLPMLKANERNTVKNALRALIAFPDPELAMTYVDALVTKHKTEAAPGPNTNAGFGSNGGNSFSTGSKKKVVIQSVQNPEAIKLLKLVEPNVDYGYNQQAWREHFASKLTRYSGNLRRDP